MNSIQTLFESHSTGMRCIVPFVKMQALGNDFVFIHEHDLESIASVCGIRMSLAAYAPLLARALCQRNFGIGADGLIIVRDSTRADCQVRWLYINSDGSQSGMCGNGLRCLALYAVHYALAAPPEFAVETAAGVAQVSFADAGNITCDLGEPILEPAAIPVLGLRENDGMVVQAQLTTASGQYLTTCVSMGNPHCVIFLDQTADKASLLRAALEIQRHEAFPEGVNVEFVNVESPEQVRIFVVERGCGATLACGTGAAATLVAGVLEQRLRRSAIIELPGGVLRASWSAADNHVYITGPAQIAFEGVFDLVQYLHLPDNEMAPL